MAENCLRLTLCFLGVGGAAAVAYAALAALMTRAGVAPWIASAFCYAVLIPVVYWTQRRVTFRSNRPHSEAFPRYVATQALGLNLAVFLPLLAPKFASGQPLVFFAAVVAGISGLNFILLKFWTFASRA